MIYVPLGVGREGKGIRHLWGPPRAPDACQELGWGEVGVSASGGPSPGPSCSSAGSCHKRPLRRPRRCPSGPSWAPWGSCRPCCGSLWQWGGGVRYPPQGGGDISPGCPSPRGARAVPSPRCPSPQLATPRRLPLHGHTHGPRPCHRHRRPPDRPGPCPFGHRSSGTCSCHTRRPTCHCLCYAGPGSAPVGSCPGWAEGRAEGWAEGTPGAVRHGVSTPAQAPHPSPPRWGPRRRQHPGRRRPRCHPGPRPPGLSWAPSRSYPAGGHEGRGHGDAPPSAGPAHRRSPALAPPTLRHWRSGQRSFSSGKPSRSVSRPHRSPLPAQPTAHLGGRRVSGGPSPRPTPAPASDPAPDPGPRPLTRPPTPTPVPDPAPDPDPARRCGRP